MANDQPDPDALRAHFGIELRRLRTRAGLSMNALAKALGCSAQWVNQLEQGDKPVPEQMAFDLDTYFQTDGWEENDGAFHRLHTAIRRAGHRRALIPGFDAYLRHESKAIGIRCFAAQVVPGLLQTEDYARATMDLSEATETQDIRVEGRINRQAILSRSKPPEAMFVLDESALRRPVGGGKVMAQQIDHLVGLTDSPNLQIRVLPFDRVTPVALVGGFILLSFAKELDLMYSESGSVSQLIENKDVTFRAGVHFNTMMGEALSQRESIELMNRYRETSP